MEWSFNQVAQYMWQRLKKVHDLYQEDAVSEIEARFGAAFVYENENGNMAISPAVLKAFRKLTDGKVVWVRNGKYWRFKELDDDEGSRVADY